MKTLQQTDNLTDQLICAVAASLKEAHDTDNKKVYEVMRKFLLPLGEFAVELDNVMRK